ncbi:MAG: hypothetical protein IKJ74_05605 [Clostridia bacterium]|nr:hypothetical protein [Clostridia bacterium]
MIVAITFGFLSLLFFAFLCYLADLLIFVYRENKAFLNRKGEILYRYQLEEKHKVKRCGRKKNYLLYLLIQTFSAQGELQRGKALLPFLKEDSLLGIKKEASN